MTKTLLCYSLKYTCMLTITTTLFFIFSTMPGSSPYFAYLTGTFTLGLAGVFKLWPTNHIYI